MAVVLAVSIVSALEIKSGTSDDLTIFLQNSSSGAPLTGKTCYFDVWDPANVKILDDGTAVELSDGFYVFATNASWTDLGNYRVLARCDLGSENVFSAMMFEVVAATIEETLGEIETTVTEINTTVNNIYSYLQNTVYPAVDTLEASAADILTNQSNLWSKLTDIQANVTTNYDEIINAQTQLSDVNATIMAELADHKDRLIEINTTTQNIYDNITATLNPKLDQLQTDADLIKGYTDTLEAEFNCGAVSAGDVCSKLNDIISYTDTLESGIADLDSDLVAWSANATTRFDMIDSSASNIYTDTQSIINSGVQLDATTNATLYNILTYSTEINTTSHNIEDYLNGAVTDYLSDINTTVTQINTTVTNMYDYLQNTIYPAIDTLEGSMADVLINQSNIWNKLVVIQANVTTNYNEIINTQDQLTAVNLSVMLQLLDNMAVLQDINDTSNSIMDHLINVTDPLINAVQSDVDSIQTGIGLLQNYTDSLEGGQSSITTLLNTIAGYTDTLEAGIAGLDSDISSMNTTIDTRFDTIDTSLSNIYSDTQSVLNSGVQLDALTNASLYQILGLVVDSNATVHQVEDYLNGAVTTFLADINTTVTDINTTVTEINQTTHATYDLLVLVNSTLSSVFSDTQDILDKWGVYDSSTLVTKLDAIDAQLDTVQASSNNSAVLSAMAALEAIVNDTRAEIGFSNKSLTVYEYFVDLDSLVQEVNTTLFNKIEFEANLTRSDIMAAIQANTTAILTAINNNNIDINSILTNWGAYDAQDIIDEIIINRNNITDVKNWLLAFNTTEADRYNDTYDLAQQILDWLPLLNSSEADRHNLTQAKIDNLLAALESNTNLSNDIIAFLGYVGKNATIYDDIVALTAQNNQIITLADEINLTTHTIDTNLIALNTTASLIYTDTQNILAKWGVLDASDLNDSLNLIDGKLDIITISSNNTPVLDAVALLEGIVNTTRSELGFAGKNLSTYDYLVNLDSLIVEVNTTIFNKIAFEGNLTRSQVIAEVQSGTTQVVNEINANEGKLDSLLVKWGTVDADDIINNITDNRNELFILQAWLNAFNVTEADRHNESNTFFQQLINWTGEFNNTEADRHNATLTIINTVLSDIEANTNLSNDIITMLGYSGVNSTMYGDVLTIIEQNNNITILVEEINLTTHSINDTLTDIIIPKLNLMHNTTQDILAKWSTYDANDLWQKTALVESKVDLMQAWLNSFNSTEQARYNMLMAEVNDTEEMLQTMLAQLNFSNKNITLYEFLVNLDDKVVNVNATLYTEMLAQGNLTRSLVDTQSTAIVAELDANEVKIDNLLTNWGGVTADDIINNITDNRDKLIELKTWLEEFNATEENRSLEIMYYLNNTILSELDYTENLSNEIIAQLGYAGKNITLYDDVALLNAQNDYITAVVEEINITLGEFYSTINLVSTALSLVLVNTNDLLDDWGSYNVSDIFDKIDIVESKVDTLQFNSTSSIIAAITSMESILNDTRDEIGFQGQSLTAYEYIVTLESELLAINSSLQTKIETEHLTTRSQLETAVNDSTNYLMANLNINQTMLDNFLQALDAYNDTNVVSEMAALRSDVQGVQSWINLLITVEDMRHDEVLNETSTILNWLNIFGTEEDDRHDNVTTQIGQLQLTLNETINLTNKIIADIGYDGINSTVYEDLVALVYSVANITGYGGLTGLDFIVLEKGANVRALPMQPTNTSIAAVMTSIDGIYIRVDWYNQTSDTWLTYNPNDPFSNTLYTMETGKPYTIWVTEDSVMFIE